MPHSSLMVFIHILYIKSNSLIVRKSSNFQLKLNATPTKKSCLQIITNIRYYILYCQSANIGHEQKTHYCRSNQFMPQSLRCNKTSMLLHVMLLILWLQCWCRGAASPHCVQYSQRDAVQMQHLLFFFFFPLEKSLKMMWLPFCSSMGGLLLTCNLLQGASPSRWGFT